MNKKGLKLLLIFLIVLIISSIAVQAQDAGILSALSKMGEFLFKDLPQMGEYGFKFLMWIILFALINYGLTRGEMFSQKIAGTISLVLSLATVILLPGNLITYIFRLYGTIIILGLGVFVPVLLWWAVHRQFKDDTVGHHVMRAVIYLIIGYALINFVAYAGPMMEAVT